MINIYLHDKEMKFNSKLEYSYSKKWNKIRENEVCKFNALLIKADNKIFICDKVTIINGLEITDVFVGGSFKEVQTSNFITKKDIKRIKKVRNFYRRKFQFGMDYSMLDMLFESEQAVERYKLLKTHNLYFKEVAND